MYATSKGCEEMTSDQIKALFPGLGFFSWSPDFVLNFAITEGFQGLYVCSSQTIALSVNDIEVLTRGEAGDHRRVDGSAVSVERLSGHEIISSRKDDPCLGNIDADWCVLKLTFRSSPAVKEIRFKGLSEKSGPENGASKKALVIFIEYPSRLSELYSAQGVAKGIIQKLQQSLDFPLDEIVEFDPNSKSTAERSDLLRSRIIEAIITGHIQVSTREAATLLPLYGPRGMVLDMELKLVAWIVLEWLGATKSVRTNHLKVFRFVLNSKKHIEEFLVILNQMASKSNQKNNLSGNNKYILSKHKLHRSVLTHEPTESVAALKNVISVIHDLGIPVFVCYGTLLGAARAGHFIEHDDDVDLLMLNDAASKEQAYSMRENVAHEISERTGFRCSVVSNVIHVFSRYVVIDLFSSWRTEEGRCVMMERKSFRSVPEDWFLPKKEVLLHGVSVPAPARYDLFLQERYGERWREEDPYHEWPWRIER